MTGSGQVYLVLDKGEVLTGSMKALVRESMAFEFKNLLPLDHKVLKTTFITQVACGESHTLLLTSSGFVHSFGSNQYGQLGVSNEEENNCEDDEELQDGFGGKKVISVVSEPEHVV